jgi:hypothetical protein
MDVNFRSALRSSFLEREDNSVGNDEREAINAAEQLLEEMASNMGARTSSRKKNKRGSSDERSSSHGETRQIRKRQALQPTSESKTKKKPLFMNMSSSMDSQENSESSISHSITGRLENLEVHGDETLGASEQGNLVMQMQEDAVEALRDPIESNRPGMARVRQALQRAQNPRLDAIPVDGRAFTNVRVAPPKLRRPERAFGKPSLLEIANCWGCRVGIGVVPTVGTEISHLETMIKETLTCTNKLAQINDIFDYYENMRSQYNVGVEKEYMLPYWSKACIWDHVYGHTMQTQAVKNKMVDVWTDVVDALYRNAFYVPKAVYDLKNGDISDNDCLIDMRYVRPLSEATKMVMTISSWVDKNEGVGYTPYSQAPNRSIVPKASQASSWCKVAKGSVLPYK